SGVDIPTLCHDRHLHPIGACRICLVEDERSSALFASCVTPIASGMVINTHSPRVMDHRKTIVGLMLASHPDSCMVCDKGNRCQLRQLAADMSIGFVDLQRIPQMATIEEVNPFIERDMSKCILCAKCIRADQELVVQGAIDYFQRGFITKPATLNDLPLEGSECTFCGTCVSICPTGALMEKDRTYGGTTKTTIPSTCPFCGCGCSLCLEVKDNHVVRVTPDQNDSVNHGTLCVRGSYGCDFIHSPERLTKPLVKSNGDFEEASWEQALELVASELGRIRDKHGPQSLAVLSSSKGTNEENYLLQRFTRCVLGTNNIDNGSRLYNSATRVGLGSSIGYVGTTKDISALEQSEVILVVGADPTSSAPVVGYAIKRAVKYKGARLILIDPRQAKLSSFAHLWLQPKVGTELVLLNSLAKVIIEEGLIDEEFITRKTDNFDALAESLQKYSLQYTETITGVPGEKIQAAARLYAAANQVAIVYGAGITRCNSGTDSVKALANLSILAGNVGRMGGGIYALQSDNNGQGACDMGALPDYLPGYQSVSDAKERKSFEECWEVHLPDDPGLTAVEVMEQAKEGNIKGLYIVGENPLLSFPDSNLVAQALASLDFLVVQDMFLTETASLASVVLPAASFAEKEGTFTNFEGRVSKVRKAIEPLGESLPDWEIILQIADKMKYPMPFSSPRHIMDEIKAIAPLHEGYTDSKKLNQSEPVFQGERQAFGGQFLKGFIRFSPVEYTPEAKETTEDYPFDLITGPILHHFGTGTRSSRSRRLNRFSPQAFVEIGESDAERLAIGNDDQVKLISPAGEVTTGVKIVDTLPAYTLFMPMSFPEAPVNKLFSIALDPQSKTPSLKTCSVRIERIDLHG
ncbi:formate dehydrogenase subunit alpha, partial [Chloroflexota bacterium]